MGNCGGVKLRCASVVATVVSVLGLAWSVQHASADDFSEPTVIAALTIDELCRAPTGMFLLLEDRLPVRPQIKRRYDQSHKLTAQRSATRAVVTIIPRGRSQSELDLIGEIPSLLSAIGECPSTAKRIPAAIAVKGLELGTAPTP